MTRSHDRDRHGEGPLLLGVDGGATKTVALVADASGRVMGAARSGSSDIHSLSDPEHAIEHIVTAVTEATAQAGADPAGSVRVVFSLCGADWPEDFELYRLELARRLGLPDSPVVVNDAIGALRSGTDDGQGVSVVVGTGIAIGARGPGGPAGRSWHQGFWGEPSGAVELGRRALIAMIRAELGIDPPTAMTDPALALFGVESVEDLLHAITGLQGSGEEGQARLAPVLLDAGHEGDAAAVAIVRSSATLIAGYAAAAGRQVGWGSGYPVVLTGGVLRHRCTDLVDGIADRLPDCAVVRTAAEPVYGALLLAFDEAGIVPDRDRLVATGPPADFFRTV
jgi:N-acetylglucosamine kinase-like BadF-type ATPase